MEYRLCQTADSGFMRAMTRDISSGLTDVDMIFMRLIGYRRTEKEVFSGMIQKRR